MQVGRVAASDVPNESAAAVKHFAADVALVTLVHHLGREHLLDHFERRQRVLSVLLRVDRRHRRRRLDPSALLAGVDVVEALLLPDRIDA